MALRGSLDSVGWVQQVIVNQRTGFMVDGHARVEEAISHGEPSVPVLYVDLSEEEEALVLATLDPITALAERDQEALSALLQEVRNSDPQLTALLATLAAEEPVQQDLYTDTVEIPHYEITGERPEVRDLFDRTKADALVGAIPKGMDQEVAAFLALAAQRHVRFD
jgi:hypothetical protein